MLYYSYSSISKLRSEQEIYMNKNKHLILDERYVIEHSLNENMSFKAIGKQILKDCTTVSKEVKSHIVFEKKGTPYKPFNDCLNRRHCSHHGDVCISCERHKSRNKCSVCGHCTTSCVDYSKEECPKLSKAPYVCNGCDMLNNCTLEKRFYKALVAQKEYELVRSESRSGFNLCEDELKQLDSVISPLLKNGQSIHHIIANNPSQPVAELDSVEGIKGGSVLLTIHFVLPKLQLAFLRDANDSKSVTDIFDALYKLLGFENFTKILPICLADNGTEFSDPFGIEADSDGVIRSRLFYCDPSSPGQKGACENNHEFIRRIIPKSTDLGQYTQSQIDIMMDHINSYGRPELGDKSPYEMFEFYYGKEILDLLGVHKIVPNEIILKPELLKNR